jgi:epoxyqueuosine reductase
MTEQVVQHSDKGDLQLPCSGPLLLHSCCAPCAGDIMARLSESKIDFTVFFYNPNIHPHEEYRLRKEENIRFAKKLNVPFVDGDYDRDDWFERIKGLEDEPERGARCTSCFDMRFQRSALYAYEHGFNIFSSTLGISRWKDMDQINASGVRASEWFPNMIYWTLNWRKGGGSKRMVDLAKEEHFYQQLYCGCVYSLRDRNRFLRSRGKPLIKRGVTFYTKDGVSQSDDQALDVQT